MIQAGNSSAAFWGLSCHRVRWACRIPSPRSCWEFLKLLYHRVLIKRAHCNGDEGTPCSLVSDQSRARAPAFPSSSQPRAGFTVSTPSVLLSVWITSEAFQIWREQKAPEGMGQWITKGKVWRGLPDFIDFCCCCCLGYNGLSQRPACCHPWSLCVSGYEWTEHEQWDAGVRTHSSSTLSLWSWRLNVMS